MKRIGAILCLSIMITLLAASTCFAAGFELVSSYPEDGENGMMPVGVAIKLTFNDDIFSDKAQKENEHCFTLVDSKNKKVPVKAYYSEKKPKDVLVLVQKDLNPKAKYKFTLSDELQSSKGVPLGEKKVINFQIRDTAKDTNVNMVLMGVMVVGMIFFTSRSAKKEMEKAQKQDEIEGRQNPYKIAKETGKPVAEVIAQLEREKAKEAKKKAKQTGGKKQDDDTDDDSQDETDDKINHYKVKAPKPIIEGGGTYKTGRKAIAEAEKAKKAAKSTNPKNTTGKKKNKKK